MAKRLGEGREVRNVSEKSGSFRHEGQVKAPPSHTWRGLHQIMPLGGRDHVERHAGELLADQSSKSRELTRVIAGYQLCAVDGERLCVTAVGGGWPPRLIGVMRSRTRFDLSCHPHQCCQPGTGRPRPTSPTGPPGPNHRRVSGPAGHQAAAGPWRRIDFLVQGAIVLRSRRDSPTLAPRTRPRGASESSGGRRRRALPRPGPRAPRRSVGSGTPTRRRGR